MTRVPDFELSGFDYEYSQVAGHLEARIRAGELAAGARLPNERALAAEYGVSLTTTRHAVAVLRDKGLLVTMPARGTYVAEPKPRKRRPGR